MFSTACVTTVTNSRIL